MNSRNERGQYLRQESDIMYDGYSVYFDKKGYACIWLNNTNKKVHVLEWEKHFGQKPNGYDIHHKDENKANWNISNLELLSYSDHRKVHAGWERQNGIWIKKPCKDCKKLLPLDKFYQRKGLTPNQRCVECTKSYLKIRNTADYKHKRKVYMKSYYQNNKAKWETY